MNLLRNLGKTTNLYFVVSGDFVKVGLATNLTERLFTLQLGNPLELRLAARRTIPKALDIQVERAVHAALTDWAIGREWFRLDAKSAVKMADPIVKKANVAAQRWRVHGINLGTGGGLDRDEVMEVIELNTVCR